MSKNKSLMCRSTEGLENHGYTCKGFFKVQEDDIFENQCKCKCHTYDYLLPYFIVLQEPISTAAVLALGDTCIPASEWQ
tara:strand:+ start:57 stop:293 length:237 start_codon:yes stop_codon:yes gene_type:complete